jgi:hypothetical protein
MKKDSQQLISLPTKCIYLPYAFSNVLLLTCIENPTGKSSNPDANFKGLSEIAQRLAASPHF